MAPKDDTRKKSPVKLTPEQEAEIETAYIALRKGGFGYGKSLELLARAFGTTERTIRNRAAKGKWTDIAKEDGPVASVAKVLESVDSEEEEHGRKLTWQANHKTISEAYWAYVQANDGSTPSAIKLAELTGLHTNTINKHVQEFYRHHHNVIATMIPNLFNVLYHRGMNGSFNHAQWLLEWWERNKPEDTTEYATAEQGQKYLESIGYTRDNLLERAAERSRRERGDDVPDVCAFTQDLRQYKGAEEEGDE